MTSIINQRMTLEAYLNYEDGTDNRYELVDGVLVAMGAENPINPQIASFLFAVFLSLGIPSYQVVIGHQLEVGQNTARQPDLIVHSEESEVAITEDGKQSSGLERSVLSLQPFDDRLCVRYQHLGVSVSR